MSVPYYTFFCFNFQSIQGKANEDSQSLQQLQTSLDHCKTQLQNALQEYDQSKQEHQKLINNKTNSIDFLTDDLNIKTKHITEIEESYKKALEMLEQSQKRIADLEDTSLRHVNDVAMEKQTNEELNQEIQLLHQKIGDLNGDIDLYQEQVDTMNQALDEAKHKFKVCFKRFLVVFYIEFTLYGYHSCNLKIFRVFRQFSHCFLGEPAVAFIQK